MKHLAAADRGRIEVLLQQQHSNATIARKLGYHKSTIGREVFRGTNFLGRYTAEYAQSEYEQRRRRCYNTPRLDKYPALGDYVTAKLQSGWDPSQIAGRLKAEEYPEQVCAETIYRWIYQSPANQNNCLYQYLRLGKKKRTKQYGRSSWRLKIPNRASIHERPLAAHERKQLGHWEGDLVVFTNKRVIATLYERSSSLGLFVQLPNKMAPNVCAALAAQLRDRIAHTLTLDNGPEFFHHERISEVSGVAVYFADTYASYQRGGNENLNRQLRAFLPKGSSIDDLTDNELQAVQDELNAKPRKRLQWHTPTEVYAWLAANPEKPLDLEEVAFDCGS